MNIQEAYPSKYLKAPDLKDRQHTLIMDRVTIEDLGDETKPVLYFQGKEKGLVMNKTNSNTVSMVYGDETDDWTGQELMIYPTMTDFQGRATPCIRVKVPAPKVQQREVVPVRANGNGHGPAPVRRPTVAQDLNDEVPF